MKVVCVGDCGVDRYVNLKLDRPGGISLNFAVNARRAFLPSDSIEVVAPLGMDAESEMVIRALGDHGLRYSLMQRPGATPVQYIDQRPDGEKVFFKYEAGVLEGLRIGEREERLIACADLLVTPLYRQVEPLFDSVMEAHSNGHRAVDFTNLSDHEPRQKLVERYIDRFTIGFFGLTPEDSGLIGDLEALARANRRLFIVTLGGHGSLALGDFGRIRCDAVPVERVVDTTGAGDTFAAGFLSEYVHSGDIASALRKGSQMAAETVQKIGAF